MTNMCDAGTCAVSSATAFVAAEGIIQSQLLLDGRARKLPLLVTGTSEPIIHHTINLQLLWVRNDVSAEVLKSQLQQS